MFMTHRRSLTLAGLLVAGALVPGAIAAETVNLQSRTVPVTASVDGYEGVLAKGNVRLLFPSAWTAKSARTSLKLRRAGAICSYSITVRFDYVLQDTGAQSAQLVKQMAPASGPYLLDDGTRGRMSWRVTRIKDTSRTRILAVRMAPTAITAGRKHPLPAGKRLFERTTITAVDGADDECHTGTYRQSLGPSLGDALVLQKGRGYLVAGK